ncbi:MAG: hypothetical protein EOP35_13725 [Rubrivivax sp.]|nr:MAG: hypothetical protein EOP35_13725 [Rubrivivax sp.]
MNNPLRHVGQTARPEEAEQAPSQQSGDAPAQGTPQNQTDNTGPNSSPPSDSELQHPKTVGTTAQKPSGPLPGKKDIPDLTPGEPPPESSAGS